MVTYFHEIHGYSLDAEVVTLFLVWYEILETVSTRAIICGPAVVLLLFHLFLISMGQSGV